MSLFNRIALPASLSFLFLHPYSYAYAPLDLLPEGHRASLIIENQNLTKLEINSSQLFPPASTLKVITALAAKLTLPDDFRFTTHLEASHDVVFRFGGDPTLTYSQLESLIIQLKKSGMEEIKGDIWLDNSVFTGYERGVGWPWDILGVCYSAPASAITLDENCVQASISTIATGDTSAFVPAHQPIVVATEAKTVTEAQQQELHCDLELIADHNNHYKLSGCLKERSRPLPLKFAVQNTQLYVESVIRSLLDKHKITFTNHFKVGKAPAAKPIATHYSRPLNKLLEDMLKDSNNLIADNLTKQIGAYYYQQPGSFASGTAAMKAVLLEKANIDIQDAQLEDGSGLSRNNKLKPHSMKEVLHYIWQHDDELDLIALMPIAGKEGTLKYRTSMRGKPITGQLQGKSGSIFGSQNMVGYGLNEKGEPKSLFVQFISDYHYSPEPKSKPVQPPIARFEKAFYRDVITFSDGQ